MRIDGPNRLETPSQSEGNEARRQAAKPTEASEASEANARIGEAACKPYIQKASACDEVNHQSVAEAKKLLESGQLDTPEAAKRAAERIISMGI
ncbi:MAG: hypothetical protein KAV00_15325 [Phycisphaerae bacterium]|nr:hypothetical protein [Phycisphaerae bacterium]